MDKLKSDEQALTEMREAPLEEELVQYLIVNESLPMSLGKIIAQGSHASVLVALREVFRDELRPVEPDPTGRGYLYLTDPEGGETPFARWINSSFKKIVLRAKQSVMEKLEQEGFIAIRDMGHTEVPPNSLTVIALPPMTRSEAAPYTKRLQVFREYAPKRDLLETVREHAKTEQAIRERISAWSQALMEVGVPGASGVDGFFVEHFAPHDDSDLLVKVVFSWGGADFTARRYLISYEDLELAPKRLIERLAEHSPREARAPVR